MREFLVQVEYRGPGSTGFEPLVRFAVTAADDADAKRLAWAVVPAIRRHSFYRIDEVQLNVTGVAEHLQALRDMYVSLSGSYGHQPLLPPPQL